MMSVYNLPKSGKPNYWYVILSFDEKETYYYYTVSSKPVNDFFDVKWKRVNELPDEILSAQPDEVNQVMLSDLPAEVDIPSDTTNF